MVYQLIWKLFSLKDLGQELEKEKNKAALTRNDLIHQENVEQKRDKFKTLKQVRAGNTKQRVDQFENLS